MQVTHLQEISDHRYLGKLLMRVGIESSVWGLLLGLIAIPSVLKGGSAIVVLWLLVIGLVGHGLFVIVKPYPKGLIVDCVLKCCLGCVLILASWPHSYFILVRAVVVPWWVIPHSYFIFVRAVVVPWWVIGLVEIASALIWGSRYKRVSHVSGPVSGEWLNYLDRLVSGVRSAAATRDPSILEVIQRAPLGTEKLKAQLYPDWAIFVGPGGREALIASRSDFELGPAGKGPVKTRVSADMKFGNRTIKMFTTPDHYNRLSEWSKQTVPTADLDLSPAGGASAVPSPSSAEFIRPTL
jgi:hypothetical protein